MSQLFTAKSEDIPFEFQAQFGDANEKERLAQFLMQQRALIQRGMQPQMVSGHYVRTNPMQYLADALASYWTGKASGDAGRAKVEVGRRMAQQEGQAVRDVQGMASVGDQAGPVDPIGAENMALASAWERARNLGKAMGEDRRAALSLGAKAATPESVVQAAQTGNVGVLKPEEPEKWSDPYLAEVTPGLPQQMVQKNLKTGELRQVNRASNTSVRVNANKDPEDPYLKESQGLMAKSDVGAYEAARSAQRGNEALARIETIIAKQPPTGGPLAVAEVWARNLAAQYGFPINKAVDTANARLSAEFTSRIAEQVLTGGRGISNDDAKRLEAAFPSFRTGIPTAELPAFISQLKAVNNARIAEWRDIHSAMDPARQKQYPLTFGPQRDIQPAGSPAVKPFADPEKERRYQEWLRTQQMGGSPVRGGQ